jgi:hypothetical protein
MLRMNKYLLAVTVAAAGCLGSAPTQTTTTTTDPTNTTTTATENPSNPSGAPSDPSLGLAPSGTAGGMDQTFDHDNTQVDPFDVLQRIQDTGAPEVSTRMHSCAKLKYATLGNVLTQLGVNMGMTSTPPSAGQLYKGGSQAMGAANYGARVREAIEGTTSGDTKLFDIFVQAAPEIIANIAKQPACMVNGAGKPMFDSVTGKCVFESLSCIMGRPATANDLTLCDLLLAQATPGDAADLTLIQNLTVAVFLSAANTCE